MRACQRDARRAAGVEIRRQILEEDAAAIIFAEVHDTDPAAREMNAGNAWRSSMRCRARRVAETVLRHMASYATLPWPLSPYCNDLANAWPRLAFEVCAPAQNGTAISAKAF